MKNKPFEMCMLFDFYGEILTDKQKELFDLYYNEDLSLAEISAHALITRQAVRDSIMRSEHILRDMEAKLGLVKRYGKVQSEVEEMKISLAQIQRINNINYNNKGLTLEAEKIDVILSRLNRDS